MSVLVDGRRLDSEQGKHTSCPGKPQILTGGRSEGLTSAFPTHRQGLTHRPVKEFYRPQLKRFSNPYLYLNTTVRADSYRGSKKTRKIIVFIYSKYILTKNMYVS